MLAFDYRACLRARPAAPPKPVVPPPPPKKPETPPQVAAAAFDPLQRKTPPKPPPRPKTPPRPPAVPARTTPPRPAPFGQFSPPKPQRMARRPPLAVVPLMQPASAQRPDKLAALGVTAEDWLEWMAIIEAGQNSNFFSKCPCLGCMYWCCPLLCLQPCLCMACPCTWKMAMDEQSNHNRVEDQIRSKCPTHFRWTVWQTGVFETTTLFELRLEQPGVHSIGAPVPAAVCVLLRAPPFAARLMSLADFSFAAACPA